MRKTRIVLTILASALVSSALAQPGAAPSAAALKAGGTSAPSQPPASVDAPAPPRDAQADAALAMQIRLRQEAELRLARYACAAGDAAKCAIVQAAKASTTASTPVP